jgi:hypothetical protein
MIRIAIPLLLVLVLMDPMHAEEVTGLIRRINLETGTLTVKLDKLGKERDFGLLKELTVSNAIGSPATSKDLVPGSHVLLQIENDFVKAIRLDGPAIYGTIKKLVARKLFVTDRMKEYSLDLPETLKIFHDGNESTLDVLNEGQLIRVLLTPNREKPLAIMAGKGIPNHDPHRHIVRQRGLMLDFDPEKRTVDLVVMPAGAPDSRRTYGLARDVPVSYYLSTTWITTGSLDRIRGIAMVYFWSDEDLGILETMEIVAPTWSRVKVKSFENNKLVIFRDAKTERSFEVGESVVFRKMERSELKPGELITILLTADLTEVVAIVRVEK